MNYDHSIFLTNCSYTQYNIFQHLNILIYIQNISSKSAHFPWCGTSNLYPATRGLCHLSIISNSLWVYSIRILNTRPLHFLRCRTSNYGVYPVSGTTSPIKIGNSQISRLQISKKLGKTPIIIFLFKNINPSS